jgi:DNA-binding MarR family transcriptional regulator
MSINKNHSTKTDIPAAISNDELLKLDNQLCFALYVCSKEIIRKYKPILDPLGITYTGYITLLALWEEDNVTVKDLGSRLYLDSGTLTPLLKKLETQGYIERIRSLLDERNVVIKLTNEGQELKKKASHVPHELICSTNFDGIDAYGLLTNLHRFMEQVIES